MIEEFHIKDDSFFQFLQDIDSLILLFLSVIRIMNRHDDQTRRRDLIEVFKKILLDYLKKSLLFGLL